MKKVITWSLILMGGVAFGAVRALTPSPQSTNATHWWQKRFAEKAALVKAGGADVVFIGDSITHFFETGAGKSVWNRIFAAAPYKALDLGFSADRTEHVIWRLTTGGELDGYKAKAIVLMIGTNNSGHFPFDAEPPIDTILGIHRILTIIREKQPQAKIILCSIFPRGITAENSCRKRNEVVNREISRFADNRTIFWCDFGRQFLTADGRLSVDIMPDSLHPAVEGYEIWASAVLPHINIALLGETPVPNLAWSSTFAPCADSAARDLESPRALRCESRIKEPSWRGEDWWMNRFARNRNQIADCGGKIDAVFAGDSITHFWESAGATEWTMLTNRFTILNAGYAGDHTGNMVWRFKNGELSGYKAKAVFMMIGTNNNGNRGIPEETAKGIADCLKLVQKFQPQAKVILMPIFPRAHKTDPLTGDNPDARNRKTNAIIQKLADGKNILWLDFNAKFMGSDGKPPKDIMQDGLHPTAKGYAIWREAVWPLLEKYCK